MNKRKEERKASALLRQQEATTRTVSERLARLDERLGIGRGAKKERAKLAKGTGAQP